MEAVRQAIRAFAIDLLNIIANIILILFGPPLIIFTWPLLAFFFIGFIILLTEKKTWIILSILYVIYLILKDP